MGFNIYVEEDEDRKIEAWQITKDHDQYVKWNKRLSEAYRDITDMFICSKPFLLQACDFAERPYYGELSPGVFFIDPHEVDFESEVFLVNTEFWEHCCGNLNVHEIVLQLGELIDDEVDRVELLTGWHLKMGLYCFGIYPNEENIPR